MKIVCWILIIVTLVTFVRLGNGIEPLPFETFLQSVKSLDASLYIKRIILDFRKAVNQEQVNFQDEYGDATTDDTSLVEGLWALTKFAYNVAYDAIVMVCRFILFPFEYAFSFLAVIFDILGYV